MTTSTVPVAVPAPADRVRPPLFPLVATTLLIAAIAAAPCRGQWVGFGDNAWPGGCASDRGSFGPGPANEVFVRLDAHEHGGWGVGGPAGFRTIDGVRFMAHDTFGPPSLVTITLYPEDPFLNHLPDMLPASAIPFGTVLVWPGACPILYQLMGPPTPVPCVRNGDIFVGFSYGFGDGIQIGRIDATRDVPGTGYLGGLGYAAPVLPSHRLERSPPMAPIAVPLLGPSQYFVDVSQGPGLVDGVGSTVTDQPLFAASAAPGTANFLSGSYPECRPSIGPRSASDSIAMTARAPWAGPGSIALFVVASGPIQPFVAEVPLSSLFPGGAGVLCLDPSTILLEVVAPLNAGQATVNYGSLWAALLGFGVTHQAFVLDVNDFTIHGGPCDRQEF